MTNGYRTNADLKAEVEQKEREHLNEVIDGVITFLEMISS